MEFPVVSSAPSLWTGPDCPVLSPSLPKGAHSSPVVKAVGLDGMQPAATMPAAPNWEVTEPALPTLWLSPAEYVARVRREPFPEAARKAFATSVRRFTFKQKLKAWHAAIPLVAGALFLATKLPSSEGFQELQTTLARRASLEVADDFRAGLSGWQGGKDWGRSWRYDRAGFARPGQMAILSKSVGLSDYEFTFLGQIEKGALSWAFRATDPGNYHAMKISITRPGPLPAASIVRYATVGGKEGKRTHLPLPLVVRGDTLYEVKVNVAGSQFTTSINGQLVDTFADRRLTSGGVGFFTEAGESARLRWVRVAHNDDLLGRLCSYLSPQNADYR